MTALAWGALLLGLAGTAFGIWQRTARQRMLRRLDRMLDRTVFGDFVEDQFDETELSSLESRMARFLQGSASVRKNIEAEQAAVKTLIADISHQTRTPIANLLLYASLLSESDLTPGQREQVQALTAQAEKLSFLIQALVKASRLEAGIVTPVPSCNPVEPLLKGAKDQEEYTAKSRQITLTVIPFQGDASFDPRWTGEALGNVVNNAVKYTPAGGTVTISAQMLDSFCRVDVSDTGPGIPESEQAEIFNRFFRGRGTRTAEGLGLGLYLAREILTRQGGYIKVSSRPGSGCIFSLYLPMEGQHAGETARK
ncbi:two-component sensor histidine kinase [Lachnoclostridium sp. An196]|uniref:sensor histidine kinase n=1 Tax=Lachnoclostridium sp. An196 TaxID=1965583 RepID=UPI000B3A1317|nr:HAMP domain-containing sensor histidine kinase [Lachnoclostridium sp. An196]OUP20223.1 two-component sensor histidine kinase [Lachnoclostridium sp. An196]